MLSIKYTALQRGRTFVFVELPHQTLMDPLVRGFLADDPGADVHIRSPVTVEIRPSVSWATLINELLAFRDDLIEGVRMEMSYGTGSVQCVVHFDMSVEELVEHVSERALMPKSFLD